jgi:hypothetical protein
MSGEDEARQAYVFDEIETGIATLRAQIGTGRSSGGTRPPRARKGFPPNLERAEVGIEPEDPRAGGQAEGADGRRCI